MTMLTTAFLQKLNTQLTRFGIELNQYIVLRMSEDAMKIIGEPKSLREIGADLHLTNPSMTGIVDKLEKLGYVVRGSVLGDRRKVAVVLTSKGHAALRAIAEGLDPRQKNDE